MNTNRLTAALLAMLVLVSAVAGTAGVALAQSSAGAPMPETSAEYTNENYNMSWSSPLTYENDQGETVTLDARVNESADNPYSFVATDVEFEDAGAFPHDKSGVSALDASEWSTSGASISATDADRGQLNIATDGSVTAGTTTTATFDNFSITSDVQKKHLAIAADVNTLDAGATVEIRAMDSDGDYVAATVNASSAESQNLLANQTGEGFVLQRQMGKMSVMGSGDGTMTEIQSVEVVVMDGDADVTVSMLNLDKMSKYTYGVEKADTDDDDDLEEEDIHEVDSPGAISIHALSSMGDTFSEATINGLTTDIVKSTSTLDGEDVEYEFNRTEDRPGYYGTATVYIPSGLPAAYDISFSNAVTEEEQVFLEDRYLEVAYAEGVGDTNPKDVDSWTDITSSYSEQDANVTIDDTIQPGQTSYVKYRLQLQQSEYNAAQSFLSNLGSGGGGGMGPGGTGGGIFSWINGLYASIVAAVGGLFARAKGVV
ncbi:hypothetical protein [Haloplanus aerogenes]|uniref:Uncharacterized protein n=1 Tax=Haloplanus aerogenes TaxID=660522 RepID=A0A3M0DZ12_9EURY|nr:hypothetical protein [Haloplanus aerogenes]AZH25279.1 hypothetical protein DU502_07755 [Haloplanus aerogenes]RMB24973.1 hypothetical protein ATH50_0054 [Haloplanus aerogenes]